MRSLRTMAEKWTYFSVHGFLYVGNHLVELVAHSLGCDTGLVETRASIKASVKEESLDDD